MGNVITAEFTLEDLWFDDYSSSFANSARYREFRYGWIYFKFHLHLLGNWFLGLLASFNPIALGERDLPYALKKKVAHWL